MPVSLCFALCFLFQCHQNVSYVYGSTLGSWYGVYGSSSRCHDFVFHLHGFQDDQDIACVYCLTWCDFHIQHGSWHRRTDCISTAGWGRRRCCRCHRSWSGRWGRCRWDRRRCWGSRDWRCRDRCCWSSSACFLYIYCVYSSIYGYIISFHVPLHFLSWYPLSFSAVYAINASRITPGCGFT